MKIKFEESRENGYLEYYAISNLEVYKGKAHDELLWSEITPGILTVTMEGKFIPTDNENDKSRIVFKVIWEDNWQNKEYFMTLQDAKNHVLKNYIHHKPHSNGAIYSIDEL